MSQNSQTGDLQMCFDTGSGCKYVCKCGLFLKDFWKISDIKFLVPTMKTSQWFESSSFSCKFKSLNCKAKAVEFMAKVSVKKVINTFFIKHEFNTIVKNPLGFSTAHFLNFVFLLTVILFYLLKSSKKAERDGWMDAWMDGLSSLFVALIWVFSH